MGNNTPNYQKYTFPELLEKYDKILVPMIQRDYAQGRTDRKATDVRNNLLNDIFSKKNVHFDLVFGSNENRIIDSKETNCFIPVDGQQRLTTLFLLYLYGQKLGKSDTKLDLSKFSYDTRRSASDFCKSVTSKEWKIQEGKSVSEVITDSSWFMDYWALDPTVEGMLNMLDAIQCKEDKPFPDLSKITFYFFDLESNGLNENLYLKMNSRGKPLTAFENLKAKIEKVLPDNIKIEEKCFPKCDTAPKGSFKEKWKYFMDRNWTDAFWTPANPDKYDVNIVKFIARFLAGYWAAFGQETAEKKTAEDLKEVNRKEQNDKNYSDYISFEPIEQVLKLDNAFTSLAYALTTAPKISPYWINDTIKEKSEYKLLTVIFTYVLFDGDETAIRFAWNMAENYVTEYDTFVTYCKRAGEIHKFKYANKNKTFYQALSDIKFDGNISDQLKEEIAKTRQILDDKKENLRKYEGICKKEDGSDYKTWEEVIRRPLRFCVSKDGSDYKTWEEVIIEAEKYAFFKGAIRFLFTKKDIGDDWEHFDTKCANAQNYFDENGVKNNTDNDKLYKSHALLMKSLLANCDDFWKNIWWHFGFSNDANRWKSILTSDRWRYAVHIIMTTEITAETTEESIKNIPEQSLIKKIVDDNLMDYVCNEMSGAWIRSTYHGYYAIWQSGYPSYQIVLNPILAQLKSKGSIEYRDENTIKDCQYYKCRDKNVDFKYKNYYFQWYGNPNEKELDIYLMTDNWADYQKRQNPTTDKGTEEDEYYCFRVDENTTQKSFTEMLYCLIQQAQADKQNKPCYDDSKNKICE